MKRNWRENEEEERDSLYIFPHFLFISPQCRTRSLNLVLALLPQILDPFGPPKKHVNFDMSIFLSETELLKCFDISGQLSQKTYSIQ